MDLLLYLTGQVPVEVHTHALPDRGRYSQDNLTATLRFADGSAGTIAYLAKGDRGLEKERLEVFSGGRAAVLEDFRRLRLASGGKCIVKKSALDKGHRAEMLALLEAVRQGNPSPIPFQESVAATSATFAILESLASGGPVAIRLPHLA